MGWTTEEASFDSRLGQEIFLLSKISRPVLVTFQFLIQWVLGALCTRVRRLKREANQSPLYIAKFNNEWSYTSTPAQAFVTYTRLTLNLHYYILKFRTEFL
jgi:hypothetical protein